MSYWADSSYNKFYENLLSTLEKKKKNAFDVGGCDIEDK